MLRVDISDVRRVVVGRVPTRAQMRDIAQRLSTAARAEWIRLAQNNLRSSQREYIQSIGDPAFTKGGMAFTISLTGALPNMVEKGWTGGDLRAFLASSSAPSAKKSKEGHWYNRIPFRHGTPGTSGKNVGPPMPGKVYKAAKQLGPRERLDHRKIMDPATRALVRQKMRKHHAAGRYQGMQRTGGGFFTFRTISEKSPRGWIHPGIRARRLAGQVQKFLGPLAKHMIEEAVS